MALPNFIIIGAHKSGTSSLYNYLDQHPEIYMSPIKEPRFFAYDENNDEHRKKARSVFPVTTMDEYRKLFDKVSAEIAIGEASPEYLNSPFAARRIKETLPDVKLIAILRNPVSRAYSHYQMNVRDGYIQGQIPPQSVNINDRWVQGSFYYERLKHYYDLFDAKQIKIILFEDFTANTNAALKEIYQYLGVDDRFECTQEAKNVGGHPKNKLLNSIISNRKIQVLLAPLLSKKLKSLVTKIYVSNLEKAPPLTESVRSQLAELYKEDIARLQGLLNRDLSVWMQK